jgi:hypothetical protein
MPQQRDRPLLQIRVIAAGSREPLRAEPDPPYRNISELPEFAGLAFSNS